MGARKTPWKVRKPTVRPHGKGWTKDSRINRARRRCSAAQRLKKVGEGILGCPTAHYLPATAY